MRASPRETLYIFPNLEESGPQKKGKILVKEHPPTASSIGYQICRYIISH
jgi:hypothetical protein